MNKYINPFNLFANPKGEMIKCSNCERFHDILRGTEMWCACGNHIKSKEFIENGSLPSGEKE